MLDIKFTPSKNLKEKPDSAKLGFGKYFTDHMFMMDYTEGLGWHDARIVPYAPISLEPSAMVFHYAQEMFEGMKAYRTKEGTVQKHRPHEQHRKKALHPAARRGRRAPGDNDAREIRGGLGPLRGGHLPLHPPVRNSD